MLIVPCRVADSWNGSSFFAAPGLVLKGNHCCFGVHHDWWFLSVHRDGITSVFVSGRDSAGLPKVVHKGFMPVMSTLQDVSQQAGMPCTLMRNRLLSLETLDFGNDRDLPNHWQFLRPFLLAAGGSIGPWRFNRWLRASCGQDYRVTGGRFGGIRVEGPEGQWESLLCWAAEKYLSRGTDGSPAPV